MHKKFFLSREYHRKTNRASELGFNTNNRTVEPVKNKHDKKRITADFSLLCQFPGFRITNSPCNLTPVLFFLQWKNIFEYKKDTTWITDEKHYDSATWEFIKFTASAYGRRWAIFPLVLPKSLHVNESARAKAYAYVRKAFTCCFS